MLSYHSFAAAWARGGRGFALQCAVTFHVSLPDALAYTRRCVALGYSS